MAQSRQGLVHPMNCDVTNLVALCIHRADTYTGRLPAVNRLIHEDAICLQFLSPSFCNRMSSIMLHHYRLLGASWRKGGQQIKWVASCLAEQLEES